MLSVSCRATVSLYRCVSVSLYHCTAVAAFRCPDICKAPDGNVSVPFRVTVSLSPLCHLSL